MLEKYQKVITGLMKDNVSYKEKNTVEQSEVLGSS